jgi:hypothetical protein
MIKKYQELAIESAENEITFRNIDVSRSRGNCRSKHRKQEEAVLEANTVGSMVRFVHFIVDIIAFFSGVRDNWNFVSVIFEGNEYILLFWF